jgi:hypothetical protein
MQVKVALVLARLSWQEIAFHELFDRRAPAIRNRRSVRLLTVTPPDA